MALPLAIGVGLVAWPLLSHTFPSAFYQISFGGTFLNKGNDGVITPQLSTFIANTLALGNITGLSIAVVPKSRKPEFRTWGYRTEDGDEVTPEVRLLPVHSLEHSRTPFAPQTLFHMASVSKAFCTTALGLLIDDFTRSRLSWQS